MPHDLRSIRQWRVGSFSLGLVLVLLGLASLLAQDNGGAAVKLLAGWWPLALVLLGVEILVAGILAPGEQPRLKYDWFAILAVVVVLGASLGLNALATSGLLPALERTFNATEYTVPLPEQRLPLDRDVKKIVMENAGANLEIRATTGNEVITFGQARLAAGSEEDALELARTAVVTTRRTGDSLFLSTIQFPVRRELGLNHQPAEENRTLLIPAGITFELGAGGQPKAGTLSVVVEHLAANWSVRSHGPVRVALGPNLDVEVWAMTPHPQALTGNLSWQVYKVQPAPDEAQVAPREEQASGPAGPVTARTTLGDGRFRLWLESTSHLEVVNSA